MSDCLLNLRFIVYAIILLLAGNLSWAEEEGGVEEAPAIDPRLSQLEDPQGIMELLPPPVSPGTREEMVTAQPAVVGEESGLDWEKIEKMMQESSHLHYRSSHENRFLVFSASPKAASWVVSVANEALRTGGRFLFQPANRGQRILVEMPLVAEGVPPSFHTTILPNGEVQLSIPWNSQVNRKLVLQGLLQALVVSEVFAEFGFEAATQVKPWTELALTVALEVQMVPTLLDEYQSHAAGLTWIPLERLFSLRQPLEHPAMVAENGFWFLRWLERYPMRPELKSRLVLLLSCTHDPARVLEQLFPREWQVEPGLECWWANRFQETTTFQNSPYWTLEKSRETLRRLSVLHFPYDSEIQVATLRDWSGWVLYSPAKKAIEIRLEELQVVLGFVHPIYYNAYLSLGLLMEFCLKDFKSEQDLTEWERLLNQVERDFRTAFRLEQDIQSKL